MLGKKHSIDLTQPVYEGGPSRIEWLRAQMESRHVGAGDLARAVQATIPDFNKGRIRNWIKGRQTHTTPEDWNAAEQALQAGIFPTSRVDLDEKLTPHSLSRREWVQAEKDGKHFEFSNLALENIESLRGVFRQKTMEWSDWVALKNAIKRAPEKPGRVPLLTPLPGTTITRLSWLRQKANDLGVAGATIFNSIVNPPNDLSFHAINGLLRTDAPDRQSIEWDHWIAIKRGIQHGNKIHGRRRELQKQDRVNLTETLYPDGPSRIEWLRSQMHAKSVGTMALFNSLSNPPAGMNYQMINSWNDGIVITASWAHWNAVKHGIRAYEKRVDLTEALYPGGPSRIEWLRAQMKAKSVGAKGLLNSLTNPPAGMNYQTINHWDRENTTTASWDHWIAVKHGIRAYQPPLKKGRGRPCKARPVASEAAQSVDTAPTPAGP